jgi:hypothetical protein
VTVEALRNDDWSTSATVRVGAWSAQFGFHATGAPVAEHADHLVGASLLPAMRAAVGPSRATTPRHGVVHRSDP